MAFQTKYEILGVSKDSTPKEVKDAYRKLAKKWHPDINKDPQATDMFEKINNAYEEITNPNHLTNGIFQFNSNFEMGDDFFSSDSGDFMDDILNEDIGKTPSKAPAIEQYVYLAIEEALFGKEMSIDVFTDRIDEKTYDISIDFLTVKLSVPAGSKNNSKIIREGIGNEAIEREKGDIHFIIAIEENLLYSIKGDDILYNFKMSNEMLENAKKSGRVIVETLEGPVKIKWNDKFLSGSTATINGFGFPKKLGDLSNRGDIIVSFFVE